MPHTRSRSHVPLRPSSVSPLRRLASLVLVTLLLALPGLAAAQSPTFVPADVSGDDDVTVVDVQGIINVALGASGMSAHDVNRDGQTNVVDVQLSINLALGNTALVAVAPATASPGNTIFLEGGGFSQTIAGNTVTIGGVSATVTAVNIVNGRAVSVEVTVPSGAGGSAITLMTAGQTLNNNSFTLNPNLPPMLATNGGLTLDEGATATIDMTALMTSDANNGPAELTYTLGVAPQNGALQLSGATLTTGGTFSQADINGGLVSYTHNGSETGADSFQFTVSDPAGAMVPATTFMITVSPINDAPSLAINAGVTVDEGSLFNTIPSAALSATDPDGNDPDIIYTVQSLPLSGTLFSGFSPLGVNDTFTQADVDGAGLEYDHDGSEVATDSFTVTLSDAAGASSATQTITITINPVNDAPTLTAPGSITGLEDATTTVTGLSAADPDAGATPVELTLSLGGGLSGGLQVPTTAPGGITAGQVTGNGTATVVVTAPLAALNATLAAGFELTTGADENGTGTLTATLSDLGATGSGGALVDIATIPLTITAVNDAPTLTLAPTATATSDGNPTTLSLTGVSTGPADESGQMLSFLASSDNLAVIPDGSIAVTGSGATRTLSVTPTAGSSGAVTITLTAMDDGSVANGGMDTVTASVTITVTAPPNALPELTTNLGLMVTEGQTAAITAARLTATDADHGPTEITFTLAALPAESTIVRDGTDLGAGGTFTQADVAAGLLSLRQNGGELSSDSFMVNLADVAGGSSGPFTVAITVTGVNDPPTLAVNTGLTIAEGATGRTLMNTALRIDDPDDAPAARTLTLDQIPQSITLRLSGAALSQGGIFTQDDINSGRVTLDHDGTETTSDSFTVTARDAAMVSVGPITVNLGITPTNDAPVLTAPTMLTAVEDTRTPITGLFVEDADVGSGSLRLTLTATNGTFSAGTGVLGGLVPGQITGNNTGTLVLEAPQLAIQNHLLDPAGLSYMGNADFAGADTISASISDLGNTGTGGAQTASASIPVTVTAVDDPPVVTNNGLTLDEAAGPITLDAARLSITDVDDAPSALTLTVTGPAVNGALRSGTTALAMNDTFTGAELAGGAINYTHDGSETTSDLINLSLSDGTSTTPVAFAITVTPVNDPPVLATPTPMVTINENATIVLNSAALSATDADHSNAQLIYTITATAPDGGLARLGSPLGQGATFSQNDVNLGRISLSQNGAENASFSIGLSLTDGVATALTPTLSVTVSPVNDAPVVAVNTGLTVTEGSIINLVGTGQLQATDDDNAAASDLTYTLDVPPVNGAFFLGVNPVGAGTTFTQDDIDNFLITYDHDGSETTTDSFAFTVRDPAGASTGRQTFTIMVTAVNDAPSLTVPASLIVEEDAAATVAGLLVSDPDSGAADLTFTMSVGFGSLSFNGAVPGAITAMNTGTLVTLTGPATELASFIQSGIRYTGGAEFAGTDSISVSVSDNGATGAGGAQSASGSISVTVTAVDDPPTLTLMSPTVAEGSKDNVFASAVFAPADVDTFPTSQTFTLVTPPTAGTLMLSGSPLAASGTFTADDVANSRITYDHDGGEAPTDSLTVTLSDGTTALAPATLTIMVSPVNDPFAGSFSPAFTMDEGAEVFLDESIFLVTDVDNTPDELTWTIATAPLRGEIRVSGVGLTMGQAFTQDDVANNRVTYAHDGSEDTSDSFGVVLSDGTASTAELTIDITLNPVNDPPMPLAAADQATLEDQMLQLPAMDFADPDLAGDPVIVVGFQVFNGIIQVDDSIPGGVVAGDFDVSGPNNTEFPILVTLASQLRATLAAGGLTYVPNSNFNGTDTFFFLMLDDVGDFGEDSLEITITPVNDAPSFDTIATQSVTSDGPKSIGLTGVRPGPGEDGQTLSFSSSSDNLAVIPDTSFSFTGSGSTRTLNFTPTTSSVGTVQITITASDDGGTLNGGVNSFMQTFTVNVSQPVGAAPVIAVNGGLTLNEGATATITTGELQITDSDTADANLVFSLSAAPTNGSLRLGGAPLTTGQTFSQADINASQLSYMHNGGETTSDSFNVTLTDGQNTIPSTGFAITVTAQNDAPVLTVPGAQTALEDQTKFISGFAVADVDVGTANVSLTFSASTGTITLDTTAQNGLTAGQVTGNGTGTVVATAPLATIQTTLDRNEGVGYRSNADSSANATLTVTLSDLGGSGAGGAQTDVETVSIVVTGVNDAPTLDAPPPVTVTSDGAAKSVTLTGVSTGPADESGQTLSFMVSSNSAAIPSGSFSISGAGASRSLSFTPDLGNLSMPPPDTATVTVTITAMDDGGTANGGSNSRTRTLIVTVNAPVNNVPAITTNNGLSVTEGGTVTAMTADLEATDADNNAMQLTFTLTTVPAGGTLRRDGAPLGTGGTFTQADVNAGLLSYLHADGEATTDSFGVTISDGTTTVGPTTISVAVAGTNDPPTLTVPGAQTGLEDAFNNLAGVVVGDPDSGNAAIQVRFSLTSGSVNVSTGVAGGVSAGQVSSNGSANVTVTAPLAAIQATFAANAGLRYTPATDSTDPFTINVTVDDLGNTGSGGAMQATGSINVSVTPINDEPTFDPIGNATVASDGSTFTTTITGVSPGPANESTQALNFTVTSNNQAVLPDGAIAITGTGSSRTLTATPTDGTAGSVVISVNLSDNGGTANGGDNIFTRTFTLTVTDGVDDSPTLAVNNGLAVNEGALATIGTGALQATDSDTADAGLTWTLTTAPTRGALRLSGGPIGQGGTFTQDDINQGRISYLHDGSESTTDSLMLMVGDATTTLPAVAFTVTVAPQNDAPVLTTPASITVLEDGMAAVTGVSATDPDAGTAALSLTLSLTAGTLTVDGSVMNGVTAGQLTANGSANVTVTAPLSAINATLAAGSGLTVTPAANDFGAETLTVTLDDQGASGGGGAQNDSRAITVNVTAVNDRPTLDPIANIAVTADGNAKMVTLTGIGPGAANEGAQSLTLTAASNNQGVIPDATFGFAGTGATRTLSFTPNAATNVTVLVTVTLMDDGGTDNSALDTRTRSFEVSVGTPPITITAITPNRGSVLGGDAVLISGSGFTAGQTVTIGGDPLLDLHLISDTLIAGRTPPAEAAENGQAVNVAVAAETLAGGFTYAAAAGGPTVTAQYPTRLQTGIPASIGFALRFDRPIDPASVSNPNGSTTTTSTAVIDAGFFKSGTTTLSEDGLWMVIRTNDPLTMGGGSVALGFAYQAAPSVKDIFGGTLTGPDDLNGRAGVEVLIRNDDVVAADTMAPMVAGTTPSPGATGVVRGRFLAVEFTEPMDPTTARAVSNANVTLAPTAGGAALPGRLEWENTLKALRFTPDQPPAPNTSYRFTIGAGVTDLSGNALSPVFFDFTTAAGSTGFRIDGLSPNEGLLIGGTPVRIIGEGFTPGCSVTIDGVACSQVVQLNRNELSFVTPPGASVGAKSVAVTRAGGDTLTLPGAFTYRDDPQAYIPPEIFFEFPPETGNGTAIIPRNSKLVFVFSEDMDSSIESISLPETIRVRDDGSTVAATAALVPGDNRILVVTPPAPFTQGVNADVFLRSLDADTGRGLRDLDGTRLDVLTFSDFRFFISDPDRGVVFRWQTGATDGSRPTITGRVPAQGSNTLGTTDIRLTFSETINPASVAATFTVTDSTGAVPGTIRYDIETLAGFTFTPSRAMTGTVTVNTGGIEDLCDNAIASPSYTFTAGTDTVNPVLSLVTLNGIPAHLAGSTANGGSSPSGGRLRAPVSGFSIDLVYSDPNGQVSLAPTAFSLTANVAVGPHAAGTNLVPLLPAANRALTTTGATFVIPAGLPFTPGPVTVTAQITDLAGNTATRQLTIETVRPLGQATAIETTETWFVSFERDFDSYAPNFTGYQLPLPVAGQANVVDANGTPDALEDLVSFGLASAGGSANVASGGLSMNTAARNWFRNRVLFYMSRDYGVDVSFSDGNPNPGFAGLIDFSPRRQAPGVNIRFVAISSDPGEGLNRLGIGGFTHPASTLGLATFDAQNDRQGHNDGVAATDPRLGSFIGNELGTHYDGSPELNIAQFRVLYDGLSPYSSPGGPTAGTPLGTDPSDPIVLDPTRDPATFTAAQMTRYRLLINGLDAAARVTASTSSHEVGHSLGLIMDGTQPNGLYGGDSNFGASTSGHVDLKEFFLGNSQNLMDPTGSFTQSVHPRTRFNRLALEYLKNRIIAGD